MKENNLKNLLASSKEMQVSLN